MHACTLVRHAQVAVTARVELVVRRPLVVLKGKAAKLLVRVVRGTFSPIRRRGVVALRSREMTVGVRSVRLKERGV